MRLYEQRPGLDFVVLCAPNSITAVNAISLPNSPIGGVLLIQPTASTPISNFYVTNYFGETYRTCYPTTTFGTCWNQQTVAGSGGTSLEFQDTSGVNFITFDGSNNRIVTEGIIPKTHNAFDLGLTGTRYQNGYFQGVINAAGGYNGGGANFAGSIQPSIDNTYSNGAPSQDWQNLYVRTIRSSSGSLSIVPPTIFTSTIEATQVNATTGFYVAGGQIIENTGPYWTGATMTPFTNNAVDLGLATKQWRHLRIAGTATFSAISGSTQCLEADTSGNISGTGSACGSGGGGVSSLAATSPITTTGATGAITIGCATCIVSGFTTLTGDVGSGQFTLRTQSGAPSPGCGLLNDGTISFDSTGHRIYVCSAGTPYYALLVP